MYLNSASLVLLYGTRLQIIDIVYTFVMLIIINFFCQLVKSQNSFQYQFLQHHSSKGFPLPGITLKRTRIFR